MIELKFQISEGDLLDGKVNHARLIEVKHWGDSQMKYQKGMAEWTLERNNPQTGIYASADTNDTNTTFTPNME